MKLFLYLFFTVLLIGGGYFLFVHQTPPASGPAATWEAEAQQHLTTLLADQLKAVGSQDWTSFDADLKKAEAHLAAAPAEANSANFRSALKGYASQQELRAQLPK